MGPFRGSWYESGVDTFHLAGSIGTDTWSDVQPGIPAELNNAIETIFSWGQGIVVVVGVIGVLFCAGKMAVGKFGRSDLAADGVGGLVWTLLGISLMLIAVPLITSLIARANGEQELGQSIPEGDSSQEFVIDPGDDDIDLVVSL